MFVSNEMQLEDNKGEKIAELFLRIRIVLQKIGKQPVLYDRIAI